MQRHYERIRKPCLVKITVYLRCNNGLVATALNIGDDESDIGPDKLFITPFSYRINSVVLLSLVGEHGRFHKVRKKAVRIVLVGRLNSGPHGFWNQEVIVHSLCLINALDSWKSNYTVGIVPPSITISVPFM